MNDWTSDGMWRLGISASESPDLARLGLVETHFRVALSEITRSVLLAGGGIIYGGRLDPNGYTDFVTRELQRYARRNRPLMACLSWDNHVNMSEQSLRDYRDELGLFGHVVCLDPEGTAVPLSGAAVHRPQGIVDDALRRRSLSGLRRFMTAQQRGRVFIGGRRRGFLGIMPGIVEELVMTIEAGQPVYLAAGFGGVTYDLACAVGVHSGDWPLTAGEGPPDPAHTRGLAALREAIAARGYSVLSNGLSEDENRALAQTHRPGEIASLITRGLGRVLQARSEA